MKWQRHPRRLAERRQCPGGIRFGLWRLPLFVLVVTSSQTHGANWEIEPQFRLSETWTDNFTLAADEADEEEEWITEVAPGIRLSGEGRRANVDLVYRMQHLAHARESNRDRTNHLLNADGGLELVRERLFFTADATRSSGTGRGNLVSTNSNAIASDQRETVTTWSAGPRFQYRFGGFAAMEAAYRRQHVDFGSRVEGDSESDLATIGLSSGPVFTTWGWALDYSRREESRDRDVTVADDDAFGEDTTLEQLRGELNLRAGAATQLFVAGGTERNEFQTAEAGEAIDGEFWETGFRWNPSRRVALEAAVGERFFGETARGSFTIRGSKLSLELGYAEDVVTTPQLQFERQQVLLTDDEGDIVLGPEGQPVTAVIDVPTVRDDVFTEQRATARLRWDHSHTTVRLSLITADREFQRRATSEQSRQTDLDVSWTRLQRTTVRAGIGLSERESVQRRDGDEVTTARLGAIRQLAPNADLELEMEHINQWGGFDVSRVTVALELVF